MDKTQENFNSTEANFNKKKVKFEQQQQQNQENEDHKSHKHENHHKSSTNDNIKQFSRAGIQSNLIYYLRQQNKNTKITPKRHYTSPFDKLKRLQNAPKFVKDNEKPSACFMNTDRNQLFKREAERTVKAENYQPKYSEIRPNPISYTIPPHPQVQPRQKIYSPPPCIVRGNTCDSEIRSLINKMKKETLIISQLQKQLSELEFKAQQSQNDEFDIGKKKKLEDGHLNEKRSITTKLQQHEANFLSNREKYNELIEQNLDLVEIKELNLISEPLPHHITGINYNNMQPRGELFDIKNKVHDISERQFQNFTEFEPKSKTFDSFKQQKNREKLFKDGLKVDTYVQSQDQYIKNNFNTGTFACLIDLKKQDQFKKQKSLEPKTTGRKEVQILQITKQAHKIPDIRGYVEMNKKTDREMPTSMQMRTIPTQMNFYNKWRSNSPIKNATVNMMDKKSSNVGDTQSNQTQTQQFRPTKFNTNKSPSPLQHNFVNNTNNYNNNTLSQEQFTATKNFLNQSPNN